jgi:hypothetical protein
MLVSLYLLAERVLAGMCVMFRCVGYGAQREQDSDVCLRHAGLRSMQQMARKVRAKGETSILDQGKLQPCLLVMQEDRTYRKRP